MTRMMLSRRTFLVVTASTAGGLAIGVGVADAKDDQVPTGGLGAPTAPTDVREVNAWVVIEPDDRIIIRVAQAEMGQGVSTGLPQIIADELDCDWAQVRVEYASANRNLREKVYGRMMTVGSMSVRTGHMMLKQAGANARARLIAAAAERWKVDPASCTAGAGVVTHAASKRKLRYGAVASAAAQVKLAAEPSLKDPKDYTYIGKPLKRVDTAVKVNGEAKYGMDMRVPGMVYAAAAMPPVPGGSLKSFDESAVLGRRGVLKVVALPHGVAVVADSYWRARQALAKLPVQWDAGVGAGVNSADIDKDYRDAAANTPMEQVKLQGDAKAALAAGKIVEAVYETPHLSHAPMEPLNCTASVQADRVDVWMGTQSTDIIAPRIAQFAGVAPEQVYVHNCYLGGGFGRRTQTDEIEQAVLISKAIGKPVKVVWSREDDLRNDNYRPQAAIAFKGALSKEGKMTAIAVRAACGALAPVRGKPVLKPGHDAASVESLSNQPYDIANQSFELAIKNTHLPTTYWRSVGSSINTFVVEGFIDEMAHAAGADPYKFRRDMLKEADWLGVLDMAAEKGDWGKPLPRGSGRGIAIGEAMGSIVAEVAEVTVTPQGALKVNRVVAVYDCGHIINPQLVEAQISGSVVFGLSAALYGEITVKDGVVEQGNFNTYKMVRQADCPKIEVYPALSGGAKWGGIGEPGVPPIAPAVTNAIFAATGKRVRRLPLSRADLSYT
ncbi:MAG: molybdopterin cofactor-binding domain-containing protein [Alphaproteobacteria bacterium]